MNQYYADESVVIFHGDCREWDGKADVIVTDPPYGLEFMGKEWDHLHLNEAFSNTEAGGLGGYKHHIRYGNDGSAMQEWHEAWASHLLGKAGWLFAFGGTRTWHRH